ncbi:MAG: hypothetical protein M1834_005107 [Cirrosporium novae-zelandiae]|nr:MAG: hypothetical protein M1834_005107 [Cirrosporium novae-zelandiae]
MICRRCLLRSARSLIRPTPPTTTASTRAFTSTTHYQTESSPSTTIATSTSAAQLFTAPLNPKAITSPKPLSKSAAKASAVPKSECPEGTFMKGLQYLKHGKDIIAQAEEEYPSWLWGCLDSGKKDNEAEAAGGDLFSKSKKQRRVAAKRLRKLAETNPESLQPKIPLTEQSVDLPGGDGSLEGALDAQQSREELTKAMRQRRRSGIREANYLRGMR